MNKRNLIVLARTEEPSDLTFYKTMLRQRNTLFKKAVVVAFADIDQFVDFIDGMDDAYSFILMIHAGIQNSTKGEDAINIPREIRDHPVYKNLKFAFISREGMQDQYYKGEKIYHANFLADQDLETFPLNILSEVRGRPVPPAVSTTGIPGEIIDSASKLASTVKQEPLDFAILTALYDDEFMVYQTACDLQGTTGLLNAKKAKFKEQKPLTYGPDYEGTFLVSHQELMGLVDAAVNTAQLISIAEPKFMLMSGVCGGRLGEVNLYDVIIPTIVHDYATGKFKAGKFESLGNKAETAKKLHKFLDRKKQHIIHNMQALIDPARSKLLNEKFKIVIDEFACGPWVVKTEGVMEKITFDHEGDAPKMANYDELPIKNISTNIKGLEMESYSLLRAGELIQKPMHFTVVAKAVMDFTNENKNDGPHGQVKTDAAYVSYLCVRAMMPLLLEFYQTEKQRIEDVKNC
jgi:nucleoside phosphorylase